MNEQERSQTRFVRILAEVERYYNEKVNTYGGTPEGVDWNSCESQMLRFEQLLKVCDITRAFSINDYGCGYGALVEYMTDKGYTFKYHGFDICHEMIGKAKGLFGPLGHCKFFTEDSRLSPADYVVASGVFNVKLQANEEEWESYVLYTLGKISELGRKGFSFNVLSKYSDPDLMRNDLYYADPLFLFDYCKRKFSRFVSLLHDYPLYEFTILVRR